MKKLIPFLFAVLLLLTSCVKESPEPIYHPTQHITGERTLEGREMLGDLYYDLYSDKTCHVADYNSDTISKSLVIPRAYEDYAVIAIEDNCFQEASYTSVTLPDTLVSIGAGAFRRCPIKTLTIPDSVKTIGKEAFDNCLFLSEVTFGKGLETVETGAFFGCKAIKEIHLSRGLKKIGEEAFASLSSLEKLTLPQGLEEIGSFAFWNSGTESLTFSIPETVKAIGVSAFAETAWLENQRSTWLIVGDGVLVKYGGSESAPTVPDKVKYLSNAFDKTPCTQITLPETLSGIAERAFENTPGLKILYTGNSETVLNELKGAV